MQSLRLSLMIGYSGPRIELPLELIWEAERLGYYAVWTAEAWGSDAITPLAFSGKHFQVPYQGEGATGLGKPLKIILQRSPEIPIYLAAIGPKNVELAAEIADGWLPFLFSPLHFETLFRPALEHGFEKAGQGKSFANFDIAPSVAVVMGDDLTACFAALKPLLALYIGGMGARGKNFYFDLAVRYGYPQAAEQIQELYLAGKKAEATAAVPDELVDEVALCGPKERIQDRLAMWQSCPLTSLNLMVSDLSSLRTMAELVS